MTEPPAFDDDVRQPHDALVKHVLTRPEAAAVELRLVLPAVLAQRLDWDTLAVEPASFVDPELRARHSDILYSVATRDGERTVFVYVLLEHQSSVDPMMAWRFHRYLTRIWERYERTQRGGLDSLPLVVPLLLFQGPRGWSAPRRLSALLDLPPGLAGVLEPPVELVFEVDDLHASVEHDRWARDEIVAYVNAARTLLFFALRPDPTVPDGSTDPILRRRLDALGPQIERVRRRLGVEAVHTLLRYLATAYRRTGLRDIVLRSASEETRSMFTSMRDEWLAEGRVEGRAQGRAEGRLLGKVEFLVQMLDRRGLVVDEAVRLRLERCEDEAELQRWFDRALTAQSMAEVFDER